MRQVAKSYIWWSAAAVLAALCLGMVPFVAVQLVAGRKGSVVYSVEGATSLSTRFKYARHCSAWRPNVRDVEHYFDAVALPSLRTELGPGKGMGMQALRNIILDSVAVDADDNDATLTVSIRIEPRPKDEFDGLRRCFHEHGADIRDGLNEWLSAEERAWRKGNGINTLRITNTKRSSNREFSFIVGMDGVSDALVPVARPVHLGSEHCVGDRVNQVVLGVECPVEEMMIPFRIEYYLGGRADMFTSAVVVMRVRGADGKTTTYRTDPVYPFGGPEMKTEGNRLEGELVAASRWRVH